MRGEDEPNAPTTYMSRTGSGGVPWMGFALFVTLATMLLTVVNNNHSYYEQELVILEDGTSSYNLCL